MHKMFQTYVSQELPSAERNSPRVHHIYSEFRENGEMSHRNPITSRSKHRHDEKNVHNLARSTVNQYNSGIPLRPNLMNVKKNFHQEECERTVSQMSDYNNIQIEKALKIHTKALEGRLEEVLQRVEKNEKQTEKLAKLCHKQNHTLKILSDFREIKDIYAVIRDQKTIQNQFNSKLMQELNHVKQSIPLLKQQIQKTSRTCQTHANKSQISFKQMQKSLLSNMEKKILSKLTEKQQQKNIGIIEQLRNQTNSLRSKLAQLQQRCPLSLASGLTHIKHTSLSSIKSSESIPVTVCQTLQTKLGSVHNISKILYYVDKNGYLLDENQYYLLDDKNEPIKMSEEHWQKLKGLCQIIVEG